MKSVETAFQEFVDAIQTADTERAYRTLAERTTQRLGFRYFAYLAFTDDAPILISSYPRSWTTRYFAEGYDHVDPVVDHARRERTLLRWDGTKPATPGSRTQRRLFEEAMDFGIRAGVTVPIMGGFGRFAAFTFAADEDSAALNRTFTEAGDVLQLLGLYYHAHVETRLVLPRSGKPQKALTQRERQCLAWAARGKTMEEIAAILHLTRRTAIFHVENARQKLGAATLTQAVATALRKGLLPW